MTSLISEEVSFWKAHPPDKEVGWWNSTAEKQEQQIQWYKYQQGIQLEALRALRPLRYEPAREVVVTCRDLWQNNEVLSEMGGDQIVDACNSVLKNLKTIAAAE